MRTTPFFICLLFFIGFSTLGQEPVEIRDVSFGTTDTVRLTQGNNYLYFSKPVFGISHIHFLGKGMRCMEQESFSKNQVKLGSERILPELEGIHEIPLNLSEPFKINDITCSNAFFMSPDTSQYRTNAALFDCFFEDAVIKAIAGQDILVLNNTIAYIPEGYAKTEVVHIGETPFVIVKANVGGILYTEWFRFGSCSENPFYTAFSYAARGIENGVRQVARGIEAGGKEAARGIGIGGKEAARGMEKGSMEAVRGAETGLENAATGIGKSVYDESKMFYKPSREFETMEGFVFEEKPLDVEPGVTIYAYYFKSKSPKANLFLIHGNGGNVSTYKGMIQTLVSGNYNVYTVDWRGYGKSTGSPEYKGVLKDTETAFNDFISCTWRDSLKVVVYGMSLGGQIATKLTSDRQQEIDALVLDGSLSSAQNLALDFMPVKFIQDNMKKEEGAFNQDYVAEKDIQKITGIPKLIIHSEIDPVVRFYHGERLYENAPNPKYFWKTRTRHIGTLEELPDEAIGKIDRLINYAE